MTRYRVCYQSVFSALHRVIGHPRGSMPHGHDFLLTVCVSSDRLDERGFVVDYYVLKEIVDDIVVKLNYSLANEVLGLESASSELIAERIQRMIAEKLGVDRGRICIKLCGPPSFCVEVEC